MQRAMRRFLHRGERKKTNVVRLAHFFKRPANAHVTRQSLAAIGRPFEGGNGGGHWKAPGDRVGRDKQGCSLPPAPTLPASRGASGGDSRYQTGRASVGQGGGSPCRYR